MFRDDLAPAVAAAALLFGFAAGARAQASEKEKPPITLKLGDAAPPLSIEKWIKGAPVAAFEPGRVYVVEFWATWCGPCIQSMPHLSELQQKYRERVTVVGVTSGDDRGNTLERVEALVLEKGDALEYTVAWDVARTTTDAYRTASGRQGIPCSFLVDGKGELAWIGHPMWLDEPLEAVVQGTWQIESGSARIARIEEAYRGIYQHISKDPARSVELLETFERNFPTYARVVETLKFDVYLSAGRFEQAYAHGARLVDKAIADRDAYALNAIAWKIVDPTGKVERRDLELAMRAAVKACELTGYENAAILDTLARAHFLRGDLEKALELQQKAVSFADGRMKESLEEVLREYEKARLE
jgi:thiol-disulfide isomerase/thioredoxin